MPSVPDEGYSRNASCALNLISTFLFKSEVINILLKKIWKIYGKKNTPNTHFITGTGIKRNCFFLKEILTKPVGCCRGRDRMIVGFTTTCAVTAYHQ